jgi:hypothetical protein
MRSCSIDKESLFIEKSRPHQLFAPDPGLALDEIHKCWGTAAVNLGVRLCWAHGVGGCLLQSVRIQAKMVMDRAFAFERVKFFPKDCALR